MGRIVAAGNIVDASRVTGFSVKPSHAIEHTGVRFLAIGIDGPRVDPARLFDGLVVPMVATGTEGVCGRDETVLPRCYSTLTRSSIPLPF